MSADESKDNTKYVYLFSEMDAAVKHMNGSWDGVRGLLGGKGANLAKMESLGLPVPYGFSISTEACLAYLKNNGYPGQMWEQVLEALKAVEKRNNKKFGDNEDPLLVSCRSGAKFSMPGMMDTVLNIGLHDGNLESMSKLTNPRFVADAYRRLIQGFGAVVLGIADEAFEDPLKEYKAKKGYESDLDMTTEDWRALAEQFKAVIKKEKGIDFPQDPIEQLRMSIGAVFGSWSGARAVAYRNKTGISHTLGTACNIQTMVFGNMGDDSATGVAFTRNPSTGLNRFFGEYLQNAQGEDVVAGIRTGKDVNNMGDDFKDAYEELKKVGEILEQNLRNMQDVEFTIQQKKLFMLQTRDGKRTARAQVKIATDMVKEGLITQDEAVLRVSAMDVNLLLLPQLDDAALAEAKKANRFLAKGVNASPGGGVGQVVFSAATAEAWHKEGKQVVLVRPFTKPEDVPGFFASVAILTAEGGATSHAAVVARQFGVPCVCGASALTIDLDAREFKLKGSDVVVREGDTISVNATTGEVYSGFIPTVEADFDNEVELNTILGWADEICKRESARGTKGETMRGLQVWANADNGIDANRARKFGAKGVGLCRTEHMFFEATRLPVVQEMILAKDDVARQVALDKLLPLQRSDFLDILRAMHDQTVIIRLIDPPLHEFLPDYKELLEEVSEMRAQHADAPELKEKEALLADVERLHESNPMMGLRGVRLAVMIPAIVDMQVRAIMEAACQLQKEGIVVHPKIMIPLTSHVNELREVQPKVINMINKVFEEQGIKTPVNVGTMIETPRAALTAGAVAELAEFFSFGTNDLTQMTYGISRDDAEREFLLEYVDKKILPSNPFQSLDPEGVGRLVRMATREGRERRPDLSVGVCGEHGGDADSIEICHKAGLNYVSCSPFRVAAARLAAAHAFLKN